MADDDKPPHRPYLLMMTSPDQRQVINSEFLVNRPASDELAAIVLKTMCYPFVGAGGPRRPRTIFCNYPEVAADLNNALVALDLTCEAREHLPGTDQIAEAMELEMREGKEAIPGLLSIPGADPSLVGHLYELAEDLYELAPWVAMTDSEYLEVRYPFDAKARYCCVMGALGEVFGLAVYDSQKSLSLAMSGINPKELFRRISHLILFFETVEATSFDDLDAIERYGWPVAGERAYPVLGRTNSDTSLRLLTLEELKWLEGCLGALVQYFGSHVAYGLGGVLPAEHLLTVGTIGGDRLVKVIQRTTFVDGSPLPE